jgi:hypothetical protein
MKRKKYSARGLIKREMIYFPLHSSTHMLLVYHDVCCITVVPTSRCFRWETISVLVPLIRVPKRMMTGRLSNWLTFSAPQITPRHNTLLKAGVDIVGISNWRPTLRTWQARFLWCWIFVSPTTVSEVALTLVLYNDNPPHTVSFMTAIPSTSGKLNSEFIRLSFLQAHRETDRFFTASGV